MATFIAFFLQSSAVADGRTITIVKKSAAMRWVRRYRAGSPLSRGFARLVPDPAEGNGGDAQVTGDEVLRDALDDPGVFLQQAKPALLGGIADAGEE